MWDLSLEKIAMFPRSLGSSSMVQDVATKDAKREVNTDFNRKFSLYMPVPLPEKEDNTLDGYISAFDRQSRRALKKKAISV